jgi:uncharacterized protein
MNRSPTLPLLWIATMFFLSTSLSTFADDTPASQTPTTEPSSAAPIISPLEMQLVFPGSKLQGQPEARLNPPLGCTLVWLHASDQTKIAGLFGRGAHQPATTLLFFYGNGMCMADALPIFNHFRSLGFNVMMVDYEGYGMSEGTPSETGCYAAADAAYEYVLTRKEVNEHRIISTGWSVGAAVAIDLASRKPVAGLATFSAFTSIDDMNKTMMTSLPAALQFNSRFDNLAKISSITCPIFMAHGTKDQLVPPEMLDRLSGAATAHVTTIHVENAGHNDIFQRGDSLYDGFKKFADNLQSAPATTSP